MKPIVLLLLFAVSLASNANTLQCSANGTDVYYINGVLTNDDQNNRDTTKILRLFDSRNNQLDSGPAIRKDGKTPGVQFIGIFNPSYGIVNDAAELFAEADYIKNGNHANPKAIFNLVRSIPESAGMFAGIVDPSHLSTVIGLFGYTNTINFATLTAIADESITKALKKSAANVNTLSTANDDVVESIASKIRKSVGNHKSLFVAHSQGNAALMAAITKVNLAQVPAEINYMKKFMGVYHVASPVTPLDSSYKSRNIRSKNDLIIGIFEEVAAKLGLNDLIKPALVTHEVVSRAPSSADPTGHYFSDTYISSGVLVRPFNIPNATPVAMSDIFVATLSDLATDLEDNCNSPIIKFDYGDRLAVEGPDDVITLSGSFGNVNLKASDLNSSYDNSLTTYSWNVPGYTEIPKQVEYPYYTFNWSFFGQTSQIDFSGKAVSFVVPFRTEFLVSVTATNVFGKTTTLNKKFLFAENKPPTITCVPVHDVDGRLHCPSNGDQFAYDCLITDDSQDVSSNIFDSGLLGGYSRTLFSSDFLLKATDKEQAVTTKLLVNYCR